MAISSQEPSANLLANLENRDVALWLRDIPHEPEERAALLQFLGLPWGLIVMERFDRNLVTELEVTASTHDPLARKRGLVQIIDSDPSRIQLPPRCLPVYLLSGRHTEPQSSFEDRLRRMTMLEEVRRSAPRELLIVSSDSKPVPPDLVDLWDAGFRAQMTFAVASDESAAAVDAWLASTPDVVTASLIRLAPVPLARAVLDRYFSTYPVGRQIVWMRDARGERHKIDVTAADEIERPILESFSLIEVRDLQPLMPDELEQDEFIGFFKDPESSWRPYAASLPWMRDRDCLERLRRHIGRLDGYGADESCVAYIQSEAGAGGTTLARALAWACARDGYPVLVAKSYPFMPDALPVVNYLNGALRLFGEQTGDLIVPRGPAASPPATEGQDENARHYEPPWIIVFDTLHWQNRSTELLQFRNEIVRSGRPVCILVVTAPGLESAYYNGAIFKPIAKLNHEMRQEGARSLGRHLNTFLRHYGRERTEAQWDAFYQEHNVRLVDDIATFWVTLSFWIQGQYDLRESIQTWIYEAFVEQRDDPTIQEALLSVAAMSSARLPLPQGLFPKAPGKWPVWQLLEDRLTDFARLGLTRIVAQGERHWALVHDILGRLLINALFYDHPMLEALGLTEAQTPEHLRFLLLRRISANPRLGETTYRKIGEEFATDIFKIDPDGGRGSFTDRWREVLDALDGMPRLLRDASRVFRHHSAISRRRIAVLDCDQYGLGEDDKRALLRRAIEDIEYALREIPYSTGSEPDLNLLNSLARAYFDLAKVEAQAGAPAEDVAALKRKANDATQRAYRESPNNSFVVETYINSLLQAAADSPEGAIENCVTALGIIYSAIHADIERNRASQLGQLAQTAVGRLLEQTPTRGMVEEPRTAVDVLKQAWLALARHRPEGAKSWSLESVPLGDKERALEVLSHRVGRSNLQVLHLRYDLICSCRPYDYTAQIEVLEPLQMTEYWLSPQLKLEYAILLFQVKRSVAGDREFRVLRRLWQTTEQFVQVPGRLRWLRDPDTRHPVLVHAINGSEFGSRAFARVREFANVEVPFRPEEHGLRDPRPGLVFSSYVSFGHNGPFLRPPSAQVPDAE